jgi:hypothetical protein
MWNSAGSEAMNLDDVIVSVESVLPVEFVFFDGVPNEREALLKWQTGSELNNSGFEVHKSINGQDYDKIGFVAGSGTTDEIKSYEFTDDRFDQSAYYRLRQIDYDGVFEWSPALYVQKQQGTVHLYPNPIDDVFNIVMDDRSIDLTVWDHAGRQSIKGTFRVNQAEKEIAGLESGHYSLQISSANHFYRTRILKR